jgi:FkbM family methyltransferase
LLLERGHSFTHSFWPAVDQYEPEVGAALQHFLKPGDVFLDCGANIGYFSVMAGHLVGSSGRVISIEANPKTQRLLERNLRLNGFGQMVCCALTDIAGELDFFMPKTGDVYSSLKTGGLVSDDNVERFRVPGRTIDEIVSSLGLHSVRLIKMDLEGAEIQALRSAERVMCELRPTIICEYGTNTWPTFGACKDDLMDLLDARHYRVNVFDLVTNQLRAVDDHMWNSAYVNLMLIPLGT